MNLFGQSGCVGVPFECMRSDHICTPRGSPRLGLMFLHAPEKVANIKTPMSLKESYYPITQANS